MLSRAKPNRQECISKETWEVIELGKVAKKHQEHGQDEKAEKRCKKRYQELNREVKRRCRRDRRVYVESEAEKAEEAGKRSDARNV